MAILSGGIIEFDLSNGSAVLKDFDAVIIAESSLDTKTGYSVDQLENQSFDINSQRSYTDDKGITWTQTIIGNSWVVTNNLGYERIETWVNDTNDIKATETFTSTNGEDYSSAYTYTDNGYT